MADTYRGNEDLPPLRLTVAEIAQIGREFETHAQTGGDVDLKFEVDFEDGTRFERTSADEFLANLDDEGERITGVTLQAFGWTAHNQDGLRSIARYVYLRLGRPAYALLDRLKRPLSPQGILAPH